MCQLVLKLRISCCRHCFVSFALADSLHTGNLFTITESSFSSNSCCPVSSINFYSGLSFSTSLNRDSAIWLQKLWDYSEGGLARLFSFLFHSLLKTFTHQLRVRRLWHFHELIRICIRTLRGFSSLYKCFGDSHIGVFYSRTQKKVPEKVVCFPYSEML